MFTIETKRAGWQSLINQRAQLKQKKGTSSVKKKALIQGGKIIMLSNGKKNNLLCLISQFNNLLMIFASFWENTPKLGEDFYKKSLATTKAAFNYF